MAIQLVRAGDERCDVCAGRNPVEVMCEDCAADLEIESGLEGELMYGTDREGRRYLDKIPDDPNSN